MSSLCEWIILETFIRGRDCLGTILDANFRTHFSFQRFPSVSPSPVMHNDYAHPTNPYPPIRHYTPTEKVFWGVRFVDFKTCFDYFDQPTKPGYWDRHNYGYVWGVIG